MTTAEVD